MCVYIMIQHNIESPSRFLCLPSNRAIYCPAILKVKTDTSGHPVGPIDITIALSTEMTSYVFESGTSAL
jgi:hypothetical protein